MGKPHVRRITSLRYQIAIPFTLLVVTAVLIPGLFAVNESFHTLTARAQEAQLLAVKIAAGHLHNNLCEKMSVVEGIAQLDSLKQMNAAQINEDIKPSFKKEVG